MKVEFFEKNGVDHIRVEVDHTHTFIGVAGAEHKRRFKADWLKYKQSQVGLPKKEAQIFPGNDEGLTLTSGVHEYTGNDFEIIDGELKEKIPLSPYKTVKVTKRKKK